MSFEGRTENCVKENTQYSWNISNIIYRTSWKCSLLQSRAVFSSPNLTEALHAAPAHSAVLYPSTWCQCFTSYDNKLQTLVCLDQPFSHCGSWPTAGSLANHHLLRRRCFYFTCPGETRNTFFSLNQMTTQTTDQFCYHQLSIIPSLCCYILLRHHQLHQPHHTN